MHRISVVIITLNEENNIVDCIRSARQVSDDIIVVDSGSDDNTVALAQQNGASVHSIEWQGYGYSRNFGAGKAREEWILALDADERITPELAASTRVINLAHNNILYKFSRENYLGDRKIRFGTLGFETVTRIYNKNFCAWDGTLVHERLVATGATKKRIKGKALHYGLRNFDDYKNKSLLYAQMSAEKYALEGRKAGYAKRIFSPLFNSLKSYVFQLGFLDGKQGILIALNIASYSWLKYYYLQQLYSELSSEEISFSSTGKIETVSN